MIFNIYYIQKNLKRLKYNQKYYKRIKILMIII